MSQTKTSSILDRMLEPVGKTMPLEYARAIAELRANPSDQARIDELADKCTEGELTDDEQDEYDDYLEAIHFIGKLQRQAMRVLANERDT